MCGPILSLIFFHRAVSGFKVRHTILQTGVCTYIVSSGRARANAASGLSCSFLNLVLGFFASDSSFRFLQREFRLLNRLLVSFSVLHLCVCVCVCGNSRALSCQLNIYIISIYVGSTLPSLLPCWRSVLLMAPPIMALFWQQ